MIKIELKKVYVILKYFEKRVADFGSEVFRMFLEG